MDDSFRTHLQTVVLFLKIQPDYLEDKVYVDLIQLAQKLASLNNKVEFYINYVKFRPKFAEMFFKELSKAVCVAGIDWWYCDDGFDWIEAIQPPLVYLKSIETTFGSKVQIASLSHLKFLCSLSVHNLTLSQRKVTFTLPNLKKLKLHNQKDTSESFGDFISSVFPNLFSITIKSRKLEKNAENLGLDNLPLSCRSLASYFKVVSNSVNLNRHQFSYLSIQVFDLADDSVIEQISLFDLKAIRIEVREVILMRETYSEYLKIIAKIIEFQPQLQIVDLVSFDFVPSDKLDELKCETLHWVNDNEGLFVSRNIKCIQFASQQKNLNLFTSHILYLSQSLSLETVYLLELLKETLDWEEVSTRLLLTDDDIPLIYSKMKSQKRCDLCNGDLA